MTADRYELATCYSTHYCNGCDTQIPPGELHIDHTRTQPCERCEKSAATGVPPGYHGHIVDVLYECLACARRNGRPEVAEPETAEQMLDLGGIA